MKIQTKNQILKEFEKKEKQAKGYYYHTLCPEHGFYLFKTEFQPNCLFCFKLAIEEIEKLRKEDRERNQIEVNLKWENQKLRKALGKKLVEEKVGGIDGGQ